MERALRRVAAEGAAPTLAAAWEIAAARLGSDERRGLRAEPGRLRAALPRDGRARRLRPGAAGAAGAHEWSEAQRLRTERLRAAIGALAAGSTTSCRPISPPRPRGAARSGCAPAWAAPAMPPCSISTPWRACWRTAASRGGLGWRAAAGASPGCSACCAASVSPRCRAAASRHGFAFSRLRGGAAGLAAAPARGRRTRRGDRHGAAGGGRRVRGILARRDCSPPSAPKRRRRGRNFPITWSASAEDAAREGGAGAAGVCRRAAVQGAGAARRPAGEPPGVGLRAGRRRVGDGRVGLGEVYVLQSAASHLFGQRGRLRAGLDLCRTGAVQVYSGAGPGRRALPPYLVSAAAMESRAFPAFVFDPVGRAGLGVALHARRQPAAQADWPLHPLDWEDAEHQRAGRDGGVHRGRFPGLRPAGGDASCRGRAGGVERAAGAGARRAGAGRRRGPRAVLFMADADGALHKVRGRRGAAARGAALPGALAVVAGTWRHRQFARGARGRGGEGGVGAARHLPPPASRPHRQRRQQRRPRRSPSRRTAIRSGLYRDRAVQQLQRVHPDQRPHVRL